MSVIISIQHPKGMLKEYIEALEDAQGELQYHLEACREDPEHHGNNAMLVDHLLEVMNEALDREQRDVLVGEIYAILDESADGKWSGSAKGLADKMRAVLDASS